MLDQTSAFPLDHRVFNGGRYLRAFDHAYDIDHYEHSILTYIGSLMPFNKGFVEQLAFPSISTISRCTKISESTVRKKIRTLEQKGYIKTEAVRFFNQRGKFQQSSNNYSLTPLPFTQFESILESLDFLESKSHRRIGSKYPLRDKSQDIPSPSSDTGDLSSEARTSQRAPLPNSVEKAIKDESPNSNSSFPQENAFVLKQAADRVIEAWEHQLQIPVAKNERERFQRQFIRVRANEVWMLERICRVISDPYLASRAKSVNFLFSGLDYALKDRAEICTKVEAALTHSKCPSDLNALLEEIPDFVSKQSKGFFSGSQSIVDQIINKPLSRAQQRLGIPISTNKINSFSELRTAIQNSMDQSVESVLRNRMEVLNSNLDLLSFTQALELFNRHANCSGKQVDHV